MPVRELLDLLVLLCLQNLQRAHLLPQRTRLSRRVLALQRQETRARLLRQLDLRELQPQPAQLLQPVQVQRVRAAALRDPLPGKRARHAVHRRHALDVVVLCVARKQRLEVELRRLELPQELRERLEVRRGGKRVEDAAEELRGEMHREVPLEYLAELRAERHLLAVQHLHCVGEVRAARDRLRLPLLAAVELPGGEEVGLGELRGVREQQPGGGEEGGGPEGGSGDLCGVAGEPGDVVVGGDDELGLAGEELEEVVLRLVEAED